MSDARQKRRESMDKAVALITQGHTVKAAALATGHTEQWIYDCRKADPSYNDRVLVAMAMARGERRQETDFIGFRQLYFDRDTPAHHAQMIDAIESAPEDSITMILAPPAHAKTSLIVDLICFRLAHDPNFRIAVISESQRLARKIVGQISRRMTDAARFGPFVSRYGPFKAPDREQQRPWNADAITLLLSSHDEKEPSLEAVGAGGQIYGSRYDLIILDDIQSTRNVNQTADLLEYFQQDVLTRPGGAGRIIIVGTRVAQGDFYEALLDLDVVDRLVKLPALRTEIVDGEPVSVALWPHRDDCEEGCRDHWPLERLERRRSRISPDTWSRVYMQEPASPHSATFTEQRIQSVLDRDYCVGDTSFGSGVIAAVDPALGGFCGFGAAAYDMNHLWLLDVESVENLGRNEEIFAHMGSFSGRYRPHTWVMEIDALQKGLSRDDRLRDMESVYGFRVREHTTKRLKADPRYGVAAMASMFGDGTFSIPYGDAASQTRVRQLLDELRAWRANIPTRLLRQDLVMTLWFIYLEWTRLRRNLGADPSAFRRQGLANPTPYVPIQKAV